jgi:hypothetical protein
MKLVEKKDGVMQQSAHTFSPLLHHFLALIVQRIEHYKALRRRHSAPYDSANSRR